jgi:hypothetical protein
MFLGKGREPMVWERFPSKPFPNVTRRLKSLQIPVPHLDTTGKALGQRQGTEGAAASPPSN